jgi:CheY-like chemotaxis protein
MASQVFTVWPTRAFLRTIDIRGRERRRRGEAVTNRTFIRSRGSANAQKIPAPCHSRSARTLESLAHSMYELSILVADDFVPWRAQARSLLQQRREWQIFEACDGLEAVHKAAELRPDIVLLDIAMPILNGIQAAHRIREASPHSRVIFVTMDGDEDVKAAALATGAQAYLSKAQAASELLPTIAATLDEYQTA